MKNKNEKGNVSKEKELNDIVYIKELLYRLKQATDEHSPFMAVIDDLLADEYSSAESRLLELNNDTDKAVYSFLTGAVIYLKGHPEQSRQHFRTASRLAPDNDIFNSAAHAENGKSGGDGCADCCQPECCECCCELTNCG